MALRTVKKLVMSKPVVEGAGVKLRRAFGFGDTTLYDPFLLFDDFRGDDPNDYEAGFPWHPHRGIETITYVLEGTVKHGDSIGNSGAIGAGDIQWMTAGSGIIHQEMPEGNKQGRMYGFQLWANLPSYLKMTKPRYQEFRSAEIPVLDEEDGTKVKVICGVYRGTKGPVEGIASDPMYLDISIPPNVTKIIPVGSGKNAFAYVFNGSAKFCDADKPLSVPTESSGWLDTDPPSEAVNRTLVLFGDGDDIKVFSGPNGVRFLLAAGKPLKEPVAWYGPIVMNTQDELRQAFKELDNGTFLKK
jgi:quercetin 2,3-dioxygenase